MRPKIFPHAHVHTQIYNVMVDIKFETFGKCSLLRDL